MEEIKFECANSYNDTFYVQDKKGTKKPANTQQTQSAGGYSKNSEEELVSVEFADKTAEASKNKFSLFSNFSFKGSKNGIIEASKQGWDGDCWLLSGINALSYSEEGRKIIKEALDYQNGYTIVHLKGFGDVVVKDNEIAAAKLAFGNTSGDDDVIIFEIAMEKVLDKIANGDETVDPDAPWFVEKKDELQSGLFGRSIDEGKINQLIYYVTGKTGEDARTPDSIKKQLETFEKNGNKNMAFGAHLQSSKTITDIYGNKVSLAGNHAYAIKEVKNGVVTFTNPWDSSKEIKVKAEDFAKTFSSTELTDLTDKNPPKNFINRTYKIDGDGNRVYTFDRSKNEYMDSQGKIVKCPKEEVTYDKNGTILRRTLYKENKTPSSTMNFDPKTGKQTGYLTYNDDGKTAVCVDYDEKEALKGYRLTECDEKGKAKNWYYFNDYKEVEKFYQRGFLKLTQFNINEIHSLLKLSDSEWQKALDYINKHPKANAAEVMKNISKTH